MPKKVIPIGNKILCVRKRIGEKLGSGILVAADATAERPTDLATVTAIPDTTFADKAMLENAEAIISGLVKRINNGEPELWESLEKFNKFVASKCLKIGDQIFISKYVGTDFFDTNSKDMQTLVAVDDIVGFVREG